MRAAAGGAFAALGAVGCAAYFTESSTSRKLARTNALLREARSAHEEGESDLALHHLRTVLVENETSRLAPLLALGIGDLCAREGDERGAEIAWEHAAVLAKARADEAREAAGSEQIASLLRKLPGPTVEMRNRRAPAPSSSATTTGFASPLSLDSTTAMVGLPWVRLAQVAHNRGDYARAETLYLRSLPIFVTKKEIRTLQQGQLRRTTHADNKASLQPLHVSSEDRAVAGSEGDAIEGDSGGQQRVHVAQGVQDRPAAAVQLDLQRPRAHAAAGVCFNLACLLAETNRQRGALALISRADELAAHAASPPEQRAQIAALRRELEQVQEEEEDALRL